MLLNQFKTGSASASTLGGSRGSAIVVKKVRNMGKPETVKASGSESASPGWLETKLGKVTGFVDKKLHGDGSAAKGANDMVEYKGTAVVVKKLKILDLMDRIADAHDDASELFQGKHVSIQLMSGEIDPSTGKGMLSKEMNFEGWVTMFDPLTAHQINFELNFSVPKTFGVPVAIIVKNSHPNEFLLENFHLDLPDKSISEYITNSWVYNTEKTEPIGPRVFFHNKAYLPHETPAALKELRAKELAELRGNGTGERKQSDRIYDYDFYNDLGKPDDAKGDAKKAAELARPPLGGNAELPFPRRVRTGRPPTKYDPKTESRYGKFYVPSDERFDYLKMSDNKADLAKAGGHIAQSKIEAKIFKKASFDSIADVKKLYAPKGENAGGINNVLPNKVDVPAKDQHPLRFLNELTAERADGQKANAFRFPIPQILQHDDQAWQTDSEFARENLAGFNPIEIKLVTEFPMKSKLGPEFGNPTSAITAKHIEGKLEGRSVEQALSEKKLFTLDHHDTFLPWVERINALPNSKTYASRVLFFLSADETLKVLAIELVLPPKSEGGDSEKIARVLTPPADTSKTDYVWEFAKSHAMNNEMSMHQAVSHFTLCHAVTEPIIIASHRHLSKLHPIMQLLLPHFRHTLEVNATARMNLLSANGTMEEIYTPREYVVRLASAYYRDNWTFESNALPKDLIKRGMAVPDSSAKHGVKLTIEDYPYASDGLELWAAMKSWNSEYIDIFYKDDSAVQADPEIQAWWNEYRNVGHGDMKDAPGWPELDSKASLAEIITTLVWICTAMHAPINFGQYDYAAWMPQHPAITRRLIPEERTKEWEEMQANPEKFWMTLISDIDTTTTAMAVFEVVAAHAPNEEYIGQRTSGWTENEKVKDAFKRYAAKLQDIDQLIQARNADKNLKNRCGVGNFPFQLLRPSSAPGVTGMGVPNSITV